MALKIHKKLAKPISYGSKRGLKDVKYIVIHYTAGKGDTAKNNVDYFATGNTAQTGAHFFVDKKGEIWKSINLNRTAWAVGKDYRSGAKGEAAYFGKCTNTNSVSIELCDCVISTNWEQMLATRQLVQYIQKKCPNAKTIIRHWDVNGKSCPLPMVGIDNEKWIVLHRFLTKGYNFKAKVTKNTAIYTSPNKTNKIKTLKKGTEVNIMELNGNWGRLKRKTNDEKDRWISLSKIKEI